MKTLLVIDMQNDFINGALGTKEAEAIVPFVKDKIKEYREAGNPVFFTRDTHGEDYLDTQGGKKSAGEALYRRNFWVADFR